MDDRGWIHIPVIAAFNRVTQLTHDLQRVKEVMRLSSLVEVHEDWVRTRDWRPFVLPNAQESVVGLTPYDVPPIAGHSSKVLHQTEDLADAESTSHEGEEEDEEDDQVEIVMDSSASQSWTSERNSG